MVLVHGSERTPVPLGGSAAKNGRTPHTLHDWVKKAKIDSGQRAGAPTDRPRS
jgi:hypothetical protein